MCTALWFYFIVFFLIFGISLFKKRLIYKNFKLLLISIASTTILLSGLTALFADMGYIKFLGTPSDKLLPLNFVLFFAIYAFVSTMSVRIVQVHLPSVKMSGRFASICFVALMTVLCIGMMFYYASLFSALVLGLNMLVFGYIYNTKPYILRRSFLVFPLFFFISIVLPVLLGFPLCFEVTGGSGFEFYWSGCSVEWFFMLLFAFHFSLLMEKY